MENWKKAYTTLFNAITDAQEHLRENNICKAMEILILVQQKTEEIYVLSDDEEWHE